MVDEGVEWYVIRDKYPVSEGHTLIILNDHRSSVSDLSGWPWAELREIIDAQMIQLRKMTGCTGFNIGINDGSAAGQTIPHLHVHLIPRHEGDCEDPRGGVRKVKPPLVDL
jgi:diadenosine tetraphosphate (Ap4A) HIT family hydrolase